MLQVQICVGSSCHLKGSYHIINTFHELIKSHDIGDRVELKASFCLGHCTKGVAVKIGENFVEDITVSNAARLFEEHVVKKLGE